MVQRAKNRLVGELSLVLNTMGMSCKRDFQVKRWSKQLKKMSDKKWRKDRTETHK